jgi:hypothetical protein
MKLSRKLVKFKLVTKVENFVLVNKCIGLVLNNHNVEVKQRMRVKINMDVKIKTVKEYICKVPKEVREGFEELRTILCAAAPEAE